MLFITTSSARHLQKQSSRFSVKKLTQNAQENVCVGVSFNKVSRLQACKFIKKGLQDRCLFPVNLVKILRTCILKNISKLLLLPIKYYTPSNNTAESVIKYSYTGSGKNSV